MTDEHPSLNITNVIPAVVAESKPEPKQAEQVLRETEESLTTLFNALLAKVESLGDMKRENLQLEREVLNRIKAQL